MKPVTEYRDRYINKVAPYVGAWIETFHGEDLEPEAVVAPYVGAWIETLLSIVSWMDLESHPTWVRGLKLIS